MGAAESLSDFANFVSMKIRLNFFVFFTRNKPIASFWILELQLAKLGDHV